MPRTWNMERTMRFMGELGRRGSRTFTNLYDNRRSIRVPRNSSVIFECDDEKALRQKTENSLGIDKQDATQNHHRLRRTSSMPSVVEALSQAVTTTERLRHYNYDVKLNKLQKRALRFTWHRLHTRNGGKRVEHVFEEIYDRLMRSLPSMREMFTTRTFLSAMSKQDVATLRDHARFTSKMFDMVIKNLDTEDKKRTDTLSEYDPVLIGRAHTCLRPYGFISSFWEKLGEITIDVVLIQEAVRDLPGAGQAWVILTACVIDQLRAGFEQRGDTANRHHACPVQQHSYANHCPSQQQRASMCEQQQPSVYDNLPSYPNANHSPPQLTCPFQGANFKFVDETPGTDDEQQQMNGASGMRLSLIEQQLLAQRQQDDLRQAEAVIAKQQSRQSSKNNSADRLAASSDEENMHHQCAPQIPRNSLPCPQKMPITHMHSADYDQQLLSPYHTQIPGKQYCSSDNLSVTSDSTISTRRSSHPGPVRDEQLA
ncbi:Globin [Aphelenchoides bicaudatus]|nr:Globin [Aphelenchoides bicaudatus]